MAVLSLLHPHTPACISLLSFHSLLPKIKKNAFPQPFDSWLYTPTTKMPDGSEVESGSTYNTLDMLYSQRSLLIIF